MKIITEVRKEEFIIKVQEILNNKFRGMEPDFELNISKEREITIEIFNKSEEQHDKFWDTYEKLFGSIDADATREILFEMFNEYLKHYNKVSAICEGSDVLVRGY
ncbi:TPA: hypothetical protein N2D99_002156 [Clostridium botulinum]|nr:hypothetical protein [Clostridium botulinum]